MDLRVGCGKVVLAGLVPVLTVVSCEKERIDLGKELVVVGVVYKGVL